jgi:amino acid transporter
LHYVGANLSAYVMNALIVVGVLVVAILVMVVGAFMDGPDDETFL